MPSELTADQLRSIKQARRDVLATLAKQWPDVAGGLYCVAIAGASAEILATANGTGQRLYCEAFNREAMRRHTVAIGREGKLMVDIMSHANGGDTAPQARLEELQRHIRVLEDAMPDKVLIEEFAGDLGRIRQSVDQQSERHTKVLGALTEVLSKINELVEAQNRSAQNFALLLAGLRLAPPPPSPAPPPRPRKMVKRRAN